MNPRPAATNEAHSEVHLRSQVRSAAAGPVGNGAAALVPRQGLAYGLLGLPLAFVALPLYVLLPNHYAREFGMPPTLSPLNQRNCPGSKS